MTDTTPAASRPASPETLVPKYQEPKYQRNSHCSFCGHAFEPDQSWPRRCVTCDNTSFVNPLPVVITLMKGLQLAHFLHVENHQEHLDQTQHAHQELPLLSLPVSV